VAIGGRHVTCGNRGQLANLPGEARHHVALTNSYGESDLDLTRRIPFFFTWLQSERRSRKMNVRFSCYQR
jgi:hypothetical protein